jgi:hypothetical protein
MPWTGWTTTDNGATWVAPPLPVTEHNQYTIEQNLETQLATIETWIANNPTGAIRTAAQTLVLARMLAGLTRAALGLYDSTGGS